MNVLLESYFFMHFLFLLLYMDGSILHTLFYSFHLTKYQRDLPNHYEAIPFVLMTVPQMHIIIYLACSLLMEI